MIIDLGEMILDGAEYAELTAFVAIYEALSFRDAAVRLGVTPSAISRTLRRLETRLGTRLINRTTRRVSPTEAGAKLYAKLVPAIASLEDAVGDVTASRSAPGGTVRINAPRLAAEFVLMPRLARFLEIWPGVQLDIVIDDALADVIAKGCDAGIRIGARLDQDMIAVRLTPDIRNAVVGSPAYFAKHPPPATPHDLAEHACINYRWTATGQLCRWSFEGPDETFDIDVSGPLVMNDTGLIRDAAIAGAGLAWLAEAAVRPYLADGSLIQILQPWCTPVPGFYLYHASRHQTPPGLRALITFLQAENSKAA